MEIIVGFKAAPNYDRGVRTLQLDGVQKQWSSLKCVIRQSEEEDAVECAEIRFVREIGGSQMVGALICIKFFLKKISVLRAAFLKTRYATISSFASRFLSAAL